MSDHSPAAADGTSTTRRMAVVVVAVVACAGLAVAAVLLRAADRAERPDRTLADSITIYETLLAYAATHARWDGVDAVVADLGRRTGHRITLLSQEREVLAGPERPAAAHPLATVDPLRVEPGLAGPAEAGTGPAGTDQAGTGQAAHGIDRRAVGPFRITPAERQSLQAFVLDQLTCVHERGLDATVQVGPNGRPFVRSLGAASDQDVVEDCRPADLPETVGSEDAALRTLNDLVLACAGWRGQRDLVLASPTRINVEALPTGLTTPQLATCLPEARRVQLRAFVAPPALLFVDGPAGSAVRGPGLSRPNVLLLAQLTAVLVVAVVVTAFAAGGRWPGRRRGRPATAAPESPDAGRRMPVIDHRQIGTLAKSFDALAEQHSHLDRQRKLMVNDIAHELRNPLTNIRSWLEAAQDGIQSADREFVDLLLEEAVILQRIIDDLRDLAAADAGNLRVDPERVYVADLLTQVVDAHRSAAQAARVQLRVEATVDPEWNVDPTRLRQVVGNLVSNAVRHTPPGGRVDVRCTVAGEELLIAVADTGVGIAPDDLPRLFDRFWRADASRERWSGGSGLGLAIARKLVEAHGGDITVTSEVGSGATFTVRLPA